MHDLEQPESQLLYLPPEAGLYVLCWHRSNTQIRQYKFDHQELM